MKRARILVAGGGLTGLAAAHRLSRDPGLEVHLREKGPHLGGLAAGCTLAGHPVEMAYHHLFTTDRAILALTAELGLEDRLVWQPGSTSIYRDGRLHPFNGALDLLRYSPCPFPDRLRTGAVVLFLKYWRDHGALEPARAAQWMARWGGAGAARTIWHPLLEGKFDAHADEVSMAWLWARLHTRANSGDRGGIRFGYYRGSFAVLVDKLAERIRASGATVATGAPLARLAPAAGGGLDVTDAAGRTERFDQVLFTGSSRAFAGLYPGTGPASAAYLAQLRAVPYLGAMCLVLASRQALPAPFWINVNEPGAPFLVFINLSRLSPPADHGGLHIYYVGAYLDHDAPLYRADEAAVRSLWLDYLRRIFPEFDAGAVADSRLFRFADAQHVVTPGHASRIPDHRTPVPGLYLANFAQVYPEDRGTNFAVREGEKLARLMREDLAAGAVRQA